jgi:hypothetical protein
MVDGHRPDVIKAAEAMTVSMVMDVLEKCPPIWIYVRFNPALITERS